MARSAEQGLIDKCAEYLRDSYGEELVKCTILDNGVDDGDGRLFTECIVRVGGHTSRWQKAFTFSDGEIEHMTWRHLG